ncbi:MAG: glycerol-3-phosphate 1-O-acyltransferase PlsY [Lachnospiraceae bacterium]|nr:glycerol-3-phosphate 1-O-acyltransferase PlsY [Lachnospiraceae bacterium]
MFRLYCLLIGYAMGLFQTSYIYGKAHGIDIREHGSGNAGTTNMLRTLGTKAGLITFAGDVLKTMAAVWICRLLFGGTYSDQLPVIICYAGLGAILGHNFPFYLGFKGGKGIACTAGFIFSLDPVMSVMGLIVFFSIFFITHYLSLGSIMVYISIFIEFVVFGILHMLMFKGATDAEVIECCVIVAFLTGMTIFKHRENIKRLMNGTEKKTYLKKNNPEIKDPEKTEKK